MNTIKYQDLPEERKEQIRNKHREAGLYDDWWDVVYEDAKEIGKQFGLAIDDIYFSGFWSQSDGACYKGSLRFKECDERDLPEEVRGVYQALHAVNSLLKIMDSDDYLFVDIKTNGRYSHEYSMDFKHEYSMDFKYYEAYEEIVDAHREDIEEALRDYARWIYRTLEKEYEYLTSDEAIDEQLHDEEYEDEQEIDG